MNATGVPLPDNESGVRTMPLLDHFSPPLKTVRFWHSFHSVWANMIASSLNKQLPPRYLASPNVHFGIEIDVATLDQTPTKNAPEASNRDWEAPAPMLTIPLTLVTDVVQIDVLDTREAAVHQIARS